MVRWKFIFVLFCSFSFFSFEGNAQGGDLEMSAYTFAIHPKVGIRAGHSQTANLIEAVYGDLKSTLFLFKDGKTSFALLTSPLGIEGTGLRDASAAEISRIVGIPKEAIIASGSHNHTIPVLDVKSEESPEKGTPQYMVWELGQEYLKGLRDAANYVKNNLQPVTVEWGKAEENRITYNRKGVRPDGSTYFVREEDRLEIEGEGYRGLIDPDAVVVLFKGKSKKAIAALTFFTGHPVAAYNPEKMMSYGQFPQEASEKLSAYLNGVPVGFVQGCAGNINAKHMLTGTIEQARHLGQQLGDSFILAAKSARPSKRKGLDWSRENVDVPLADLPDEKVLERDLALMDGFIKRGKEGDENTLSCIGMNFPKALSPPYRARLVELTRPWYVWALEQHKTKNLKNVPKFLPIQIVVARFGDVGFVGLPFESFVETGLKIKRESSLPIVLTAGYTDGTFGYIPDASGVDHREYMSGNFRYRRGAKDVKDAKGKIITSDFIPPYKAPGADACAEVAVEKLKEFDDLNQSGRKETTNKGSR
jgi:hypothetical protein